jgi:hemerythrin
MGVQFIWSDEYSVGNAEIDNQHKHLFLVANSLPEKPEVPEIRKIIMTFFKYVREHFTAEERMMKEIGFPEAASHRELHEVLISKLSAVAEGPLAGDAAADGFKQFVRDWITDHILNHDMRYFRFAQGR